MLDFNDDLYRQYIHKSRYARFLDDKGRRENWEETVQRFMDNIVIPKLPSGSDYWKQAIHQAILNQEVMPSMRAMMTAGEAADRDNTCIYNCSYLPIDDPRAFDEAMYILLCGTGVGFSVEDKYVRKLPEVPNEFEYTNSTLTVGDSKEGWARSFRLLLSHLWAGEIPIVDYSKIRPAGSRLKIFGGRASGPGPLQDLFQFTIETFKFAKGRKLYTIECHDIMCKIGEVVVVGGVRRSAMISLSDLHDDRMRHAKTGNWWEQHGYRALANNSAVYEYKPSVGEFMREWSAIYDSHSGERGIFNRDASRKQAAKNGRRKDAEFGTNPCSEIILRPYQFCNLTEVVLRNTDTPTDVFRKLEVATILGTIQSCYTHFPYLRKIWTRNTEEERLLGVSITGLYDNVEAWVDTNSLREFKDHVVYTNKVWAEKLGIPESVATTCVKPSGTVSQLTNSASGCHPRHSEYYIRTVRGDNKDPLTQFMISKGIPNEPCVMKPESTTVFSFPQSCPGAVTRDTVDSLTHLWDWLSLQRHWCEHKPSVTINLKEDEWPLMGSEVWQYFDEITGVSFLPHDGGTYRQAPYQECTKEQYEELLAKMPTLNFDEFNEVTDNVEGAQMLACTAGVCSI